MTANWNRKKLRDLLVIACGLAAYCAIAVIAGIPCPIKWLTGISCPGCGMTRSVLALLRLDFSAALQLHPLVFYLLLAAPTMVILHLRNQNKPCKRLLLVSAGLMVAVYLWRMIFLHSSVLEFAPKEGLIGQIVIQILSKLP